MKGKNFSCNNTGKRKKNDFYQTPFSMTEQLLENEFFDYKKSVLEPACGKGAITQVLNRTENFNTNLIYYDRYALGDFFQHNFLDESQNYNYIITNPPFSLAFEFIQKAKKVARLKFAMLLPLTYLQGKARYEGKIFSDKDYPLSTIHVFTRYVMFSDDIRKDGKYETGMKAHAWFVWQKGCEHLPEIKWINNQQYVLTAKEK